MVTKIITLKKLRTGEKIRVKFGGDAPAFPEERQPDAKLYGRKRPGYPAGIQPTVVKPLPESDRPPWCRKGPRAPKGVQIDCLPPHLYPPFNAQMFDKADMANLVGGGIANQVVTQYVVPKRHYARLWKIGQGIKGQDWDSNTWDQVTWEILINNRTLKAHAPSFKFQRGRIFDPTEIFAIAEQDDVISIWAQTNIAPGTVTVYCRIMGWVWPM